VGSVDFSDSEQRTIELLQGDKRSPGRKSPTELEAACRGACGVVAPSRRRAEPPRPCIIFTEMLEWTPFEPSTPIDRALDDVFDNVRIPARR
jgi:hypothetical protein